MDNKTATTNHNSHMRKLAIDLLPIVNFIMFFIAVFPLQAINIITNLSHTDLSCIAVAIIALVLLFSIASSYMITPLERMAIASIIGADGAAMGGWHMEGPYFFPADKLWHTTILAVVVCIIPGMYIYKGIAFFDGETFIYNCSFALISLLLQIVSLGAYKRQLEFERHIQKDQNKKMDETV